MINRPLRITAVLADVAVELEHAMAKRGPIRTPHEGYGVIREEFEVELFAQLICRDRGSGPEARAEAIQVAASAVRYVLDLCDQQHDPGCHAAGLPVGDSCGCMGRRR